MYIQPTSIPESLSRQEAKSLKRGSFTLKNLGLNILLIAGLYAVNKLGQFGNIVCLSGLAVMAVRSVSGALKAMAILSLVVLGNPFIVDKTVILTLFRFPIIGIAGARILYEMFRYRQDIMRLPYLNALLLFGLSCVVMAPINGYFVSVSVLKSVIFTFGAYSILVGTEICRTRMSDLTMFFTAVLLFLALGSFATFPLGISHVIGLKETGFANAHAGLAGITSHQQALGSFLAISLVLAFTLALYAKLPHRWVLVLFILMAMPLILMTISRTAVGTLVLSILAVVGATPFFVRRQKAQFNRIRPLPWVAGTISILIIAIFYDIFTGGSISKKVMDFALKGMSGQVYQVQAADFATSRMFLIERSWYTFLEHPIAGINFGTSVNPWFAANATLLSAPTEKGFLPTAVLEEVGVVGATFFITFLILMFRRLYSEENIIGFAVFIAFLIQNLGEMMFFSFGGVGLYCWSMVGGAIAIGYRHQYMRRI
jgi:hypothetical protein